MDTGKLKQGLSRPPMHVTVHSVSNFKPTHRLPKSVVLWFRVGCWMAEAFGIASAIYLTLRRSSNLRTVWWIPYPIAQWADYHGRVRNLFAYAILAMPVLLVVRDHRKQLKWMASLGLLGTVLEYGQLFIPTRWFEWQDIALSLAGLLVAWVLVEGVRLILRRIRPTPTA